jgi:hypothetical protein
MLQLPGGASATPWPMPSQSRRSEFPRARWEQSNEHLVIMSRDTVVGSRKKAARRATDNFGGSRAYSSIRGKPA